MRGRLVVILGILSAIFMACPLCSPAQAQSRVALVVGNTTYKDVPPLINPSGDAQATTEALEHLGFVVSKLSDATYEDLRRALLEFGRAARQADIAIVYFAGHGIEIKGENWLIPVDALLKNDVDVGSEAIALRSVMLSVSSAKEVGIVILDACRDNPFAASMETSNRGRALLSNRGLVRVEPDENILVAFAAKEGTTAVEGGGPHSPFTSALLKNIEVPGLEIGFLFRNIRDDVLDATNGDQEPAVYGSLSKQEIYLRPPARSEAASPAVVAPAADEIAWSFLRDSPDVSTLQMFVEQFPSSTYLGPARERVAILLRPQKGPQPAPTAEEIGWALLEDSDDIAALRRFVDLFPASARAAEARARITALEGQVASGAATASTPSLPIAAYASHKIEHVARRVHKNTAEVEGAWRVLRNTSDAYVLRRFAAEFPHRSYVNAAKVRLADLGYDWHPEHRGRASSRQDDGEYYLRECDRLAADPGDGNRPSGVAGVHFGRLDFGAGATACRRAVAAYPEVLRLKFQLCRSLAKSHPTEAIELCKSAAASAQASGDQSADLYAATAAGIQPLSGTGAAGPATNNPVAQFKPGAGSSMTPLKPGSRHESQRENARTRHASHQHHESHMRVHEGARPRFGATTRTSVNATSTVKNSAPHGGGEGAHGGGHRSDAALKHGVTLLGRLDNGLGLYRFSYYGSDKAYVGVIAQEVQTVMPEAVVRGRDGYLRVFYEKLGLKFQTYDRWIATGASTK